MKKRKITLLTIAVMLMCMMSTVSADAEECVNGFEKADYEKFNSYASENGLKDTPIYIEGEVCIKIESINVLGFILRQDDGNTWHVAVWNNIDIAENIVDNILGKKVRVFGLYLGFSDLLHTPGVTVIDKNAYIELENENGSFDKVWSFSEWIADNNELINSGTDNEETEEIVTEDEDISWEDKLKIDLNAILSENVASKAYDILVNQIGFTKIEYIGQNEVGGSNYDFNAEPYYFTITASDDVYRIFQPSGGAVFYEDGAVKQTISELSNKVIDSSDQSAYYIMAKEIVESCLVNPRSADFPSITFSASDIRMQRKGDIVGVQSYVDSKNALGAVVRSQWLVEFQVIDLDSFSYNTLYVQIDGETSGEFIDLN